MWLFDQTWLNFVSSPLRSTTWTMKFQDMSHRMTPLSCIRRRIWTTRPTSSKSSPCEWSHTKSGSMVSLQEMMNSGSNRLGLCRSSLTLCHSPWHCLLRWEPVDAWWCMWLLILIAPSCLMLVSWHHRSFIYTDSHTYLYIVYIIE